MCHSSHRALRHRLFSCGRLLALWLCLGPATGGFAVETTVLQDVVLRNWDLDDGLPSARINAVARTSDGYLWLATQKGLVRFDGARFVTFDAGAVTALKAGKSVVSEKPLAVNRVDGKAVIDAASAAAVTGHAS